MLPATTETESRIPLELRGVTTIDVRTAAKVLKIGRDAAYTAVRNGQIESLRFAHRIRIPVEPLLRQLGYID